MKPEEFTSLKDRLPDDKKHIIVTNNLNAVNAHGEMSHVWMVTLLRETDHVPDGGFITYSDYGVITNLTHWKYA